jgi:hypothetical protein
MAMLATVLLASRLQSTFHVFVLLSLSVETFAFIPLFHRYLMVRLNFCCTSRKCTAMQIFTLLSKSMYPKISCISSTILILVTASLLNDISWTISVVFTLLNISVILICPLWLRKSYARKRCDLFVKYI